MKLRAGKIPITRVASHATDIIEHPELVPDPIIAFAEIVGEKTSWPAPTAAASIRKSPLVPGLS
jgi:hypothetical protein